jgi:putative glycosyltransferase (TIGR04372 family)
VERPEDLPFREQAVDALQYSYLGPRCADGSTRLLWGVAAETYRRWSAEGRKPLLSLPPAIDERGRQTLAAAGIPRDAWFVALHVRESGSNVAYRGVHNVLSARIGDYLPAITEIRSRGGWVIRMGDPTMAKLLPMPKVLDYCHSPLRSDWMDVFIAARCRFLLGTSSGPAYVPPAYGVPSMLTNWWPPAQRPWHAGDIFIPKRYLRLPDRHRLSLKETLIEPFAWCNAVNYLKDRHGLIVEDNDPEDIRDATIEMLERLDGTARYDNEDLRRRELAHSIHESRQAYGSAVLSRDLLRKYPDYLT